MAEWPAFVEYAFCSVQVIGKDEDHIKEFAKHWGGLGLDAFAHALQGGKYKDQQVAAFALGYTRSAWAKDLLLPFLHHERSEVRWAVALMLGEMREETVFPMLLHMITEFFPPHPPVEYDWYDVKHLHVADILGSWGKKEAISPLREALAQLWRVEQQKPEHEGSLQLWLDYQDAVAYALGQLGAFDALAGLEASSSRRKFWAITLVLGYLNMEHLARNTLIGLLVDVSRNKELMELLSPVPNLLQEKMGFSEQEAMGFSEVYQQEYFSRLG